MVCFTMCLCRYEGRLSFYSCELVFAYLVSVDRVVHDGSKNDCNGPIFTGM